MSEFEDDVDVVQYDTFAEGIEGIVSSIRKIFTGQNDTKNDAEKTLPTVTTPSVGTVTAQNAVVVANNKTSVSNLRAADIQKILAIGSALANKNYGQAFQSIVSAAANASTEAEKQRLQQQAVDNGMGAEAARRRNKNETAEAAVAAEVVTAALAIAQGRSLGAAGILNLVINAAGKIINQSANVTQSTKHPKPEDSYVAQQNAEQQRQRQLALAAFTTALSLARGKRVPTNLMGPFIASSFGGMTGPYKSGQSVVYAFPEETSDGNYVDVLDEDLQRRYGTNTT